MQQTHDQAAFLQKLASTQQPENFHPRRQQALLSQQQVQLKADFQFSPNKNGPSAVESDSIVGRSWIDHRLALGLLDAIVDDPGCGSIMDRPPIDLALTQQYSSIERWSIMDRRWIYVGAP